MRYFIFYLKMWFTNGKLNWKDSKMFGTKKNHLISYQGGEGLTLFSFVKIGNTDNYHTSVYYIGDLLWSGDLENFNDLNLLCKQYLTTKESKRIIKFTSKYKFLKAFYV